MEEAFALLRFEADAERLLQRRAHRPERGRVARRLDPGEAVAGVGGEQPGEVAGLGQRRAVRERPGEVFAEPRAGLAGEGARLLDPPPEFFGAPGEPQGFELRRPARRVVGDQHEVAQIGYASTSR